MPSIEDVIQQEDFDKFAERWHKEHFSNEEIDRMITNSFVLASQTLGDYYTTNKMLRIILESRYFLCIPKELLDKLSRIGRIELTVNIHFNLALKNPDLYRKRYSIKNLEKGRITPFG